MTESLIQMFPLKVFESFLLQFWERAMLTDGEPYAVFPEEDKGKKLTDFSKVREEIERQTNNEVKGKV